MDRLTAYRSAHPTKAVTTPVGTFRYTDGGAGPRTVVVLHGGGSVAEAAHPFSLALEDAGCRVIALDWPDTAHSIDDVLGGLAAVLAAERIDRVALLGFSMGGMIAQCWARERPERVERLVLYVSMGPSWRYAKRFAMYRRVLSLVPAAWLRAASRRAVAKWAAQGSSQDPEGAAFVAAHRRWMFDQGKVTKRNLLSDADVLVDFFRRSFAPGGIACPVLVVEAAGDRLVDAEERAALKRLYPLAHVETLPVADHFAGVLAPAPITALLRSFLADAPIVPK